MALRDRRKQINGISVSLSIAIFVSCNFEAFYTAITTIQNCISLILTLNLKQHNTGEHEASKKKAIKEMPRSICLTYLAILAVEPRC